MPFEGWWKLVVTTIEKLGIKGDGVTTIDGRAVNVAYALPGETVRIKVEGSRGELDEIITRSSQRVTPPCSHFGVCGGCTLQHWQLASYSNWKESLVLSALREAGIDGELEPLRHYPPASRRRTTFSAQKIGRDLRLGFHTARTHDIVDLGECVILVPELETIIPSLRDMLLVSLQSGGEARLNVTFATNGIDCAVVGSPLSGKRAREIVSSIPQSLIRLVWNGDTILLREPPTVNFGGVSVALPDASFLQAVEACERDMSEFVVNALRDKNGMSGPVCDLFSGLGAFTFPSAKFSSVTAFEMDRRAVSAVQQAARYATGIKPVTAVQRDLYRNPLSPIELNRYQAAIIDPPREGAEAQFAALARSKVQTIIALSCNPVTFARDVAHLVQSGFTFTSLAAFDQFAFSHHVEIAGIFKNLGFIKKERRTKARPLS